MRATASALLDQVTIQVVTTASGTEVETPATLEAGVWCQVRTLRGDEQARHAAVGATLTHRVTMRYRTDVTPAHRLVWGTRTLQVHAAFDPDGDRRWIVLDCTERV